MILVDTSVWVSYLRNAPVPEVDRLDELMGSEVLCTCGPIITELLLGTRTTTEQRIVRAALRLVRVLPVNLRAYVLAGRLYRAARARGRTVRSTVDCIIAACAIHHDIPLLHRDRDFAAIAAVSRLKLASGEA